jgi:hypothetical protein
MAEGGASHTFFIPRWHPATLNQLLGGHWSRGHKLKKQDAAMIAAYALKIPRAVGPRRVGLTLVMAKGARRPDPDSSHKSVLDSLVKAGLLVNDSPRWVELEPLRYERTQDWGTRITLTDMSPP